MEVNIDSLLQVMYIDLLSQMRRNGMENSQTARWELDDNIVELTLTVKNVNNLLRGNEHWIK